MDNIKQPNPREVSLSRFLRALARPLSDESMSLYTIARDGSYRRKYKPPRRKKDRRLARLKRLVEPLTTTMPRK